MGEAGRRLALKGGRWQRGLTTYARYPDEDRNGPGAGTTISRSGRSDPASNQCSIRRNEIDWLGGTRGTPAAQIGAGKPAGVFELLIPQMHFVGQRMRGESQHQRTRETAKVARSDIRSYRRSLPSLRRPRAPRHPRAIRPVRRSRRWWSSGRRGHAACRPSSARSPSLTSTMIAGSMRGNCSCRQAGLVHTSTWPPLAGTVLAPQVPQ